MTGVLLSLFAMAAVTAGQRVYQMPPQPVVVAPAGQTLGYFIMSGNVILSQAFPNPAACTAALQKIQATRAPGTGNLVCAHRAP